MLPPDCLIPMQSQLDSTVLLNKLFDIERGIGTVDSVTLRNLVIDAEDCLLQAQREKAQAVQCRSCIVRLFHSPPDPNLRGFLNLKNELTATRFRHAL
jgi:hypothetical protein